MSQACVVAIDGPAGSGKSTVARHVATRLGYLLVETGGMYRAVAYMLLQTGLSPQWDEHTERWLKNIDLQCTWHQHRLQIHVLGQTFASNDARFYLPQISEVTGIIASWAPLRARLVSYQRQLIAQLPQGYGVVMEGRDIGTVVVPDCPLKFFLDAELGARATRRYHDLLSLGMACEWEQVKSDMAQRDLRDKQRAVGPLVPAKDASYIDCTSKTIDEVSNTIVAKVKEHCILLKK